MEIGDCIKEIFVIVWWVPNFTTYSGISWVSLLTENKILPMACIVLHYMTSAYSPTFLLPFYWAPTSDLSFSNTKSLLPQRLCTCCSLSLQCSLAISSHGWFFRKLFLNHTLPCHCHITLLYLVCIFVLRLFTYFLSVTAVVTTM